MAGSDGMGSRREPCIALHVCCGPCATVALERLVARGRVVAIWYNPNIHPVDEYRRRLEAARAVSRHFGVAMVELEPDVQAWFEAVRGLEGEPEGGKRCEVCIAMRLEGAAREAAKWGCASLTTTLTVGPQKDVEKIHCIGQRIAQRFGLEWIAETFRKAGGFQRSVQISKELGLYRQNYCGCIFSKREAEQRRRRRG